MPEPPLPMSRDESTRRAGRCRWFELRLFEVMGGWVPTTPEPEVKLRLEADAAKHAWHAELWAGRVRDPDEVAEPANDDVVRFVEALAAPGATDERLAGVYRVALPHLVAVYFAHLDACSPVTDGPTARWLRVILADELDDWREGERVLQRLVSSPEDAERLAAHTGKLSALLVRAGGVDGPATFDLR